MENNDEEVDFKPSSRPLLALSGFSDDPSLNNDLEADYANLLDDPRPGTAYSEQECDSHFPNPRSRPALGCPLPSSTALPFGPLCPPL